MPSEYAWMKTVKGFLLDITGVLYNSSPTGGSVIHGSVEALQRLYNESRVCFVSNESTSEREYLIQKLGRLGLQLRVQDVFLPAPLAAKYVADNDLRPHLLVHPGIHSEFADAMGVGPTNCVVVGDAEEDFTYANMNDAFRVLLESDDPLLISLGCGRFYQRVDGPCLDVGAFCEALKYATNCRHVVIGKPQDSYFLAALDHLQLTKDEVVMIGDDIQGDIGGAQAAGIRAIQVRTGKWRKEGENHQIKPDFIADNLLHAVNTVLDAQK